MAEEKYYLEIESDPNNLITVEEFINYFAKDLGLDDDKLSALLLAVTEATTNAIIHANKSDKTKLVQITAKVIEGKLYITIKDQGPGFQPEAVPDPTDPENLLKDSGRGLYLMRVYMDDLRYNITPEGTETTLVLNIS
ncbi:MAG TPA: ATP-binding protein [Ignavibacteriaceae bacterium]|nr:ATP-binding protein [Ignavibacteriaceae bacterium]